MHIVRVFTFAWVQQPEQKQYYCLVALFAAMIICIDLKLHIFIIYLKLHCISAALIINMPSTGINGNRNSPHVQDIQYGQQTQKINVYR